MKTASSNEKGLGHASLRAFTLLEILVSVSIVAVLVALLLPTLSKMKESAGAAACVGNMRQIGVAVHLYVNDNNRYMPADPNSYWDDVLVRAGYASLALTRHGCVANKSKVGGTYSYNYLELGGFEHPARRITSVTIPSETIMLSDAHKFGNPDPKTTYPSTLVYWDDRAWLGDWAPFGHKKGANLLWVDGHVSWMKYKDVVSDPTPPGNPNHGLFTYGANKTYYFMREKLLP